MSGEAPSRRLRVGVDVLAVDEVARSLRCFGDRYLARLFTPHELETSHGDPASLAARFCAKEAVVKVLEPEGPHPGWQAIEVCRAPHGACTLRLHGAAAARAAELGIEELAVSLSHDAGIAAAVVVGSSGASS